MHSEEKRIWGIHTKDDNLFLHQDVIAIGWKDMGDLRDISFREMVIFTEGVTGKEALIKLNGIKSRISEEGFRIN